MCSNNFIIITTNLGQHGGTLVSSDASQQGPEFSSTFLSVWSLQVLSRYSPFLPQSKSSTAQSKHMQLVGLGQLESLNCPYV